MGTILQIEEGKTLDAKPLITYNPPMRHPVAETDIYEDLLTTQLMWSPAFPPFFSLSQANERDRVEGNFSGCS